MVAALKAPGAGWLPAWAEVGEDGGLWLDWCYFGAQPLREPFYQDSLARAMRLPLNQLLRHRTPIDALERHHAASPGLPPRGFVFHSSRCGSTLVAQLLAATRGAVVLSEPPPLDAVLAAIAGAGTPLESRQGRWLAWLLSALGQPRRPGDRHLYVKLDAWHALQLPIIRQVFPEVPWVFLYRDPLEVLASHLRQPGAFLVPARGGPVFAPRAEAADSLAATLAGWMQRIFEAVLSALPGGRGMLVNYAELPEAVTGRIGPHFGVEFAAADREAMVVVAGQDAKTPALAFEPRPAGQAAPPNVDAGEILQRAMPGFRELERWRLATRISG